MLCYENGKLLQDFAAFNELKITDNFFRKKDMHKYTWSARGQRLIIDYIITNNKLAGQVKNTRVYKEPDIGSDHFLVISTIETYKK